MSSVGNGHGGCAPSTCDDILLQSQILLDLDPDVNLHVAVSRDYAQSSLGSTLQCMDPISPNEWVCLGCFATGTIVPLQQHAQSRLARDLLAHHAILPERDSHRSVQLVMTHMVAWEHLDAFKVLLRDATTEVHTVHGGYTRVHLNESTAARNANSHALCAVVVHVDRVQSLISWMCCGRNAQIKLGCPALCVQKSAFSVVLAPFAPPSSPVRPEAAATSSVSCDDLLLEECADDDVMWVDFDNPLSIMDKVAMAPPANRTQSPTAVEFADDELWTMSDEFAVLPSIACLVPTPADQQLPQPQVHLPASPSQQRLYYDHVDHHDNLDSLAVATFVDDDGMPLEFKTLYYRNNKKGGVRNLRYAPPHRPVAVIDPIPPRCFPHCKRGHHSTTSFCGTNLKVQFHRRHHPAITVMPPLSTESTAVVVAFGRFRNFVEPVEEFSAGMWVPQADIYHAVRSKDHPKAMWLQTKCVEPLLFEIRPSGRSLSWHYGFHGAALHKAMVHCIEVVFFETRAAAATTFQCVGVVQSPRFRIVSSRSRES
ncbi:hypothetical protein B5M09_008080 [Aphanomyces astaci]|uniref:Uncharacterized protein n=1 Tax=Aphanomyces astaci TaxID=112090 RepID=A0A425DLZ3_APHAT|nr:hypothetical protein B5M09_008080 [Aphanomyces astaci]